MGDFGPAYASRNAPRTLYRCEDCGAALPFSGGEGSCSLCGGNLRAIGPDAVSGPAPAGREAVAQLAAEVLQQIVPQELLEELALPSADRGTEESVLEELPVEKVEPFALLSVWRAADDDAVAADAAAPLLELRGTGSTFGSPLSEGGVAGPLVFAAPADGAAALTNDAAALRGALVVMRRGGCSFVDKVRRAQAAGAAACVVVQTGDVWPFSMSDTTGAGADLELPSLMLRPADGGALSALGAAPLRARARVVDAHTTCAVCQEELLASSLAVKLGCGHRFHEDCIKRWLTKQHTCPTCRAPLPTKDARPADGGGDGGGATPPTWSDFPVPRSGGGPGGGPAGMYT